MCFIDSENTMVDDSLCEGPCSAKPYDYTECNGAKTCKYPSITLSMFYHVAIIYLK